MTCRRRYSSVEWDSSRVLMIGRSKVGLQADFDVDVVGALAELIAGDFAVLADSYAAGAGVDLAGDEVEGHQARD